MSFHEGELAVQNRAGVQHEAARLEGMLDPTTLSAGANKFLAGQTFAVLTGRDAAGALWTSPLWGPAGFLTGVDSHLEIAATIPDGDPLSGLPTGQDVALIAIDLAARRRFRINGTLVGRSDAHLVIEVEQAFGNCPQYIHPRPAGTGRATADGRRHDGEPLSPRAISVARNADTFFLGTIHPSRGADASHRGGPVGFVDATETTVSWPDFPGNNMFNSFGNLAVDPSAALLFVQFSATDSADSADSAATVVPATLQLSGRADVRWDETGPTGRTVVFDVEQWVGFGLD